MPLLPEAKNCDVSIKKNFRRISKELGYTASPTFVGLTLEDLLTNTITIKDSDGNIVFYVDVNELYFVAETAVPIATGVVMPWLFYFTYTV